MRHEPATLTPRSNPDATAFVQKHPKFGHLELVLDIHTPAANAILGSGDRIITSHIAEALADAQQGGLLIHFSGAR